MACFSKDSIAQFRQRFSPDVADVCPDHHTLPAVFDRLLFLQSIITELEAV